MAAASLLALIDDIATVLDDVAVLTKVAAKKTTGVLGDDLALNAQQVAGVSADRELPVVLAVAKGSFFNKVILVPAALVISAFAPMLISPLLMLGGVYLCFEGVEKLAHKWLHSEAEVLGHQRELAQALIDPTVDWVALEQEKIKGAIRTDFVLSAEIIAITLGAVAGSTLVTQATVLAAMAVLMTVGVYGIVAGIVKIDDLGLYLFRCEGVLRPALGRGLLAFAPWLMKGLSVAGTVAMFLVGGGILTHGWPWLHHLLAHVGGEMGTWPLFGSTLGWLGPLLLDAATGVVAGSLALAGWRGIQGLRARLQQRR